MPEQSREVSKTIHFFENLSPQALAGLDQIYSEDACFKDPFNEVRGREEIKGIFSAMFSQLDGAQFVVNRALQQAPESALSRPGDAFLTWDFRFHFKRFQRDKEQRIHGATLLEFTSEGLILTHRDYWDAAEELYEKIPWLGGFMRLLKRQAQHR
jgi:steroid Delta-isomerase